MSIKYWLIGAGLLLIGVLSGYVLAEYAETRDYESYEECVVDLLPKVSTERAAAIISQVCDTKHQKTNPFDKFDPK